ncbi:hypothetical protein Leryth_006171 [Lithospermum erythrorhizon]|nr:hypothetical protein Leryth_006171 [Lithospermum erythrorhizon]
MSLNIMKELPESRSSCENLKETELTLGLPGETRLQKSGTKRGFYETVDLKLGQFENDKESEDSIVEDEEKAPPKAQLVGWPPVRANRKNITIKNKYVKVAVDGAPFLRKVDLETFNSYHHLLNVFQDMFTCLTIRNVMNEKKLVDTTNGSEYVATYEDKDGDWMLLGDVPWKMFVESCKKMRLMTSSKAIGLAPRTPSKSLTASC